MTNPWLTRDARRVLAAAARRHVYATPDGTVLMLTRIGLSKRCARTVAALTEAGLLEKPAGDNVYQLTDLGRQAHTPNGSQT